MNPFLHVSCLLFVPGNRPERFLKARAASPDGIVIDLEDAVAPSGKQAARQETARFLAQAPPGALILVRINALGTRAALDDLAALADRSLPAHGLVLPKIEHPRDIEIIRAHVAEATPLLATIETARGLEHAAAIASVAGTSALGFGGADLAADLGATMDWDALLGARATMVRAAAIGRVPLLDVPTLDVADAERLREECRRALAMGFSGKFAIHPNQVAPTRAAFAPTPEQVARARRIIEAHQAAGGDVVVVDGRMIDGPVVEQASRVLARAPSPT